MKRVLALLVALGAVLVAGVPAGAATRSTAQAPSATPTPGPLGPLATCVAGRKQLAVVLLMDESASLKTTDPRNDRVAAAQAAVAGLTDLVRRSNGKVRIDAQVAGFGVDVEPDAPWTTLSPDALPGVADRVGSFAGRNNGLDTDYVNALQGALENLRTRSSAMTGADGTAPCTAVLWFTDGRYSVEDRTNAARRNSGRDNRGESQTKAYATDVDLYVRGGGGRAMERGRAVLCDAGGVADQYEQTETTLVAVPLTVDIPPGDQDLLNRVVAGPDCGGANGTGRGAVFPAGNVQDLISTFDEIVSQLGSPAETLPPADLATCPTAQAACPTGTKTFEVDGVMARFHLLAVVNAPGIEVRLTAPGGAAPLVVPPAGSGPSSGEGSTGATKVRWNWISGNALAVDAEAAPNGLNWAGTWAATFVDTTGANPGAPVRARIYLYGDFVPTVVPAVAGAKGPVEFRAGETNEFGVILTRADGSPVPSESISGTVTVSGSVTDPATGQEQDLGEFRQEAGRWVGAYDAPLDLTVPNVNVTLRAAVTTRSGVALPPVVASSAVPILPPVGYPQVLTRTLRVGPVVGVDPARGVIQLKGSPRARTCVWLDGVSYDPGPVTAKELKWKVAGKGAGSGDCVQLDRSGSGQLELEFTPTEATRAITTGTIGLSTRPLDSDDARPTRVGLEVQLVKPASAEVAWAIFLALLLIGVGVPLAAFYVSNWVVAKFAPLRLLQGCDVKVAIDDRGVTREEPLPNGALFTPDDFSNEGFGGAANNGERVRKFAFKGVPFSSAVSSNPFRPPYGRAGDGTAAALGSARGTTAGPFGRVSLWVTREWVFLPDEVTDPEAPVTGRLIAFVLATERMAAIAHLETSLRDRLPALVDLARSRRVVRVVEVAPEMPPFGPGPGPDVWGDGPGPAGSGPAPPGSTSSPVWETGGASTTVAAPPPPPPPPPPGPTPPQPSGPWPGPNGPAGNENDIWGDGPGRA